MFGGKFIRPFSNRSCHRRGRAIGGFLDRWDDERIVALHANDSKTAYNSYHDRHENIGEGYIGMDGFKNLAKEKRLRDKAWILEVPGFEGKGPDKRSVAAAFGIVAFALWER
ncbi:MAG: TIM barrel protein [bacterium]|nr:TIM barrel protein [bacterium]MDZ4295751.1 TIM barrel protein [Patescibacteria group bacterium]